jgi:hypothetical protein
MFTNNLNAYLDPSFGTRPQVARDIQTAGENFNAGVDRSATDSSQALALKAAGLGQTDNAISSSNLDFTKNKFGLLSNLNNAYATMIGEGDKVYNDKVRRFGDYTSIEGAKVQNRASGVNGIFNGFNSDFNDAMQVLGIATGMPGVGMGTKKAPQQQTVQGGWSR